MSNLLTATVTIEGIRPLLWNAFTMATIPLEKPERTGVAGNDPEEWRRSVLTTPEGQLYVEPTYLFACLRDGAKHTRKGRSSLQPMVVATLQILDPRILVNRFLPTNTTQLTTDSAAPVYLDIRSVRNPATRARNIRYRVAAGPGWQLTFHALWDATVVSRQQMEAVIRDSGKLAGLGDGRQIGFGRFELGSFELDRS